MRAPRSSAAPGASSTPRWPPPSSRRCAAGTACRYGGPRLALVAPGTDAETAQRLLDQAVSGLPPEAEIRIGTATGGAGDRGADVVRRAREALRTGARPASGRPS